MPQFVKAQRGYINLDHVAFMFVKDDGDLVCYSAEGNEIGTINGDVGRQVMGEKGSPRPEPDPEMQAKALALAKKFQR